MNETEVIGALAALAHPVRLKVFRALVVSGAQGLTPGVMQDGLGVPAATLSFHLKELASSGLVTHERSSRNLVYRAATDRMSGLLSYLERHCAETGTGGRTSHPTGAAWAHGGGVPARRQAPG